jgi:hypothetical protein
MLKTLKKAGGATLVKLGSVEAQSLTVSTSGVKTAVAPAASSKGPLPSYEMSTPPGTTAIMHTPDTTSYMISPSLSIVATKLATDPTFAMVTAGDGISRVLPSYAFRVDTGHFGPKSSDDMSVTTKKMQPYETLTGISQERPEIVMMTNFKPLYDHDQRSAAQGRGNNIDAAKRYLSFMTDAGMFFETQMHLRSMRQYDVKGVVATLKAQYPYLAQQFAARRSDFSQALDELNTSVNFLWGLVGTIEQTKNQLDLRNDVHTVDPNEVIRNHVIHFTPVRSEALLQNLTTTIASTLPTSYTIVDVMTQLGYTTDNVNQTYSSTKLWMQMLLDLKDILRTHSLSLIDIDPTDQRNDTSSVNLTKSAVKRFEFSNFLPTLPTIDKLRNAKPTAIPAIIQSVTESYDSIYEDVHLKSDEMTIAALTNTISREFRYSKGLASEELKRVLSDYYGYTTQDRGNPLVLDFVIGRFGSNVSDIPALKTNSLVSVAQQQPATNVAVLTFESKYLEGDTGTLTPGSAYYVDSSLTTDGKSFDTSKMEDLANLLDNTYNQFSIVVDGMNLLSADTVDTTNTATSKFVQTLSNPRSLFSELWKQFVTTTGNPLPLTRDDRLTPVFAAAKSDPKLRAALMLYLVSRMTRAYDPSLSFFGSDMTEDNTPTTTALIDQIMKILDTRPLSTVTSTVVVKKTKFGGASSSGAVTSSSNTVTRDAIKASLKSGTKLVTAIQTFLVKALGAFQKDNAAINVDVTRFGGHIDTVIMMSLFDLVIAVLNKYSNQDIVGHQIDKGVATFTIKYTATNSTNSIHEVDSRLLREITLAQRTVYSVLNTTHKMTNVVSNVVNMLKNASTLKQLQSISALFDDPNLIPMLFSEQQIMMLASAVADLQHALATDLASGATQGDIDGSGKFDADDEVKALDDSVITPQLRDALLGHVSTAEFATTKAYNKKILTVGIPLGFARLLKQKIDIGKLQSTSFKNKQNDIIRINVYKVDLQNQDIIYKPQKFLFELSRFPVRNNDYILPVDTNQPGGISVNDIVNAIPTRDASKSFGDGANVQYRVAYGNVSTTPFDDASYSFMTQDEQDELLRNHVDSYLWEVYVKVMTGVSTADHNFDLVTPPRSVEQDFIKTMVEHVVHRAAALTLSMPKSTSSPSVGGFLFAGAAKKPKFASAPSSPATFDFTVTAPISSLVQKPPSTLTTSLSTMSPKQTPFLLHTLGTISNFANMMTPLASGLVLSKRLIQPKQFDRVFNIMIDPDDFEIDYARTVSTPYGKQAFELMVTKGDVVPVTNQSPSQFSFASANQGNEFRAHDRDKGEGDLIFEKYIVNVETFGEEEV